ncbi:MAG: hypothetical protein P8182_15190 [Deltaproteobacteria bacterium]
MIRRILKLRSIMKNRRLTLSELELLRRKKLQAVIRNAYDHVPYYRSLFRSVGLSPEDIRTPQDLEHVPVTTKDDLRAAGTANVISRWADLSTCIPTRTHGSSGKPFMVYRTPSEHTTLPMLNMASLMAIGFGPRDRLAVLGPDSLKPPGLHQRWGLYRREHIPLSTPLSEQISRLIDFRPTLLWSYPSALRALIHYLDRPVTSIMHPRILITSAEVFDDVLKKRVRSELDADWYNFYLTHEFGQIAWECTEHRGLHLNSDQFILECLDNGGPAPIGKQGVTVLTSLYSFAMPLIRYNLGDLCAYSTDQCGCGCPFPLLEPPTGREHEMLLTPSGKILSPQRVAHILCGFEGVDQWRLIQETRRRFVLKLVMHGQPDHEGLQRIRSQFLEYVDEPVTLDIEFPDYMDEGALKFRTFVSNVRSALP